MMVNLKRGALRSYRKENHPLLRRSSDGFSPPRMRCRHVHLLLRDVNNLL